MKAAVFDMDGTLVDVSTMWHLLGEVPYRNGQHAFHTAVADAPPNDWVVNAARRLHRAGVAVLVFTARKSLWRDGAAGWLATNKVPIAGLWMRANDDNRPDPDVKRDMLAEVRRLGFEPEMAYDDHPGVLAMFEEEGLRTVQVL